jgi:anthranilate synthase/aminodeoxychorismate synthase-like glutamine amidotransferase
MTFLVDNYDSFTYNLFQYLGELGEEVVVRRNDGFQLEEIERLKPERIVISPGPGMPSEAGLSKKVIRKFAGVVPILGVCLGHQAIGEEFGGKIVLAEGLMHGKTSEILHDGKGLGCSKTYHVLSLLRDIIHWLLKEKVCPSVSRYVPTPGMG